MTSKIQILNRSFSRVNFATSALTKGKSEGVMRAELKVSLSPDVEEYTKRCLRAKMIIKTAEESRSVFTAEAFISVKIDASSPEAAEKIIRKYAEEIGYTEMYNLFGFLTPSHNPLVKFSKLGNHPNKKASSNIGVEQ